MAPGIQAWLSRTALLPLAVFVAAAMSLACPPASEPRDGGPSSGDGASPVDATSPDQGVDAALPPDAGQADVFWADATSADANSRDVASNDAATCSPASFDLCDGVLGSGSSYTLDLTARSLGGDRSLSLGSTLTQVRATLSALSEQASPFNDFSRVYCSEGLLLYFADNLADASNKGVLSDDDTLYKISAFGSFSGNTATSPSLSLGSSSTDVSSALGTADQTGTATSMSGEAGEYRYFHQGYSVSLENDAIVSISVFAPQADANGMGAAISFASGTVGSITVSHETFGPAAFPTGSTLTEIRAAFGPSPEAEGDITVDVGSNSVDLLMLSYSVLGLRFTGTNSQLSVSGDDRKVFTAVLSPPFQGSDNGVGIGATRAEIEARFGAAYASETDAEGRTLHKYNAGTKKLGVVYVDDSACVERAALFFVNLIDL